MVHEAVLAKAIQEPSAAQPSKSSSSDSGKQDLTLKRGWHTPCHCSTVYSCAVLSLT